MTTLGNGLMQASPTQAMLALIVGTRQGMNKTAQFRKREWDLVKGRGWRTGL
jgi:hypothetical protein